MSQQVVIRELNRWPWGYQAIRYNQNGFGRCVVECSHLEDIRREANRIAKAYGAFLIDTTIDTNK